MRRRRRKTSSPFRSLFLLALCLALVGWGLWQAEKLRRSVKAPLPPAFAVAPDADNLVDVSNTHGEQDPIAMTGPVQPQPLAGRGAVEAPTGPMLTPLAYPNFDHNLTANDLIIQATQSLSKGDNVAARFALNEALARTADENQAGELRQSLAGQNQRVLLGTDLLAGDPAARMVNIAAGDNFISIARNYGLTAAFVQAINPQLSATNLRPGSPIKIVQGPFSARVIKHAGRLDIYARDLYVMSCPVHFPEGNDLPRGEYQITPGTKLQLDRGRMWIGFQGITPENEGVERGWIYGSAGPRGNSAKDRATGMVLSDADLGLLYLVLVEARSRLRVEP